ncbi:hypothetical protein T484DRAFT_1986411, partial [Baffinella frigidus]
MRSKYQTRNPQPRDPKHQTPNMKHQHEPTRDTKHPRPATRNPKASLTPCIRAFARLDVQLCGVLRPTPWP